MTDPLIDDLAETDERPRPPPRPRCSPPPSGCSPCTASRTSRCATSPPRRASTWPRVNYHFGSKDALLFEIFRRRTGELNRERARMLHEANDRHGGKPPVREILEALFAPPLRWADPANDRRISVQFIIRARSEGTAEMREALQNDVSPPGPLRRRAEGRPARPAAARPSTGGCTSRWAWSTTTASSSSTACTTSPAA